MRAVEYSVVIPVYRSADTLRELTRRLCLVLDGAGRNYEIIFVDDGSPDRSWDVLRELCAAQPGRVVAVQLMRNFGQHNALMCGFRRARGEYVVTMDDDLQNPPEEIPKLIAALKQGDYDLVYGTYGGKKHSAWRNLSSGVVNAFYRRVFRSSVTVTSFRIIRRALLQSIFSYDLNFTFVDGLLAWNTQRIGQVVVEHRPRAHGRSGYSLAKLVMLALNLFTNFSLLPLQMVSLIGLLTALLGLGVAVMYLVRYLLQEITVPGYASTIIAILVLGGVQLLSLGIMGEYLGRLHLNVNRKPQYVERQAIGPQSGDGVESMWTANDASQCSPA
jgi:undecaprenyl-phosphate 4-deoxy-4-formamido-L-arabinose transferase